MGTTKEKSSGVKNNEPQIWTHLIDQELLYNTDIRAYSGVLVEAPFSKGVNVPQEAPAKIAVWAGWQIIRLYMDKHPDVSLAQLLADIDHDKILRESGYKP